MAANLLGSCPSGKFGKKGWKRVEGGGWKRFRFKPKREGVSCTRSRMIVAGVVIATRRN